MKLICIRHGCACKCMSGFSLVEVVVVILIIGIIALMALRSPFSSNADLISEADLLRSRLRYAQSLAMASNADSWGIVIRVDGYSLYKNGAISAASLPGASSATHTFLSGIRVVQGSGIVLFDEWGSPGNADTSVTLSDGDHSSVITLIAETGCQL